MLTLDSIQTLACGGLCLVAGYAIRRHVPLLALAVLACRHWDYTPVQFDTALKQPLMIAFFTSIGFNASVALLKVGGRQVAWLLGLATNAIVITIFVNGWT